MKSPELPTRTVSAIHFEDFDGKAFERLVYAYHARSDRWVSLEWYGQAGKDHGRDIVGVRLRDGYSKGEKTLILCANWQKLTLAKIKKDMNRAVTSSFGLPDRVLVVGGNIVPGKIRDGAKAHALSLGIDNCEVWGGAEFEEQLRKTSESLLQRFCEGEVFPDADRELLLYSWGVVPVDDKERLELITRAFDRPAFQTPIWQESSLPAFRGAIDDTVRVLKTGVWQTREGALIQRLPASKDVCDTTVRGHLARTSRGLVALRTAFDDGIRDGSIRHCSCGDPDCPTYMIIDEMRKELTDLRASALEPFRHARECCGLPGEWINYE